MGKGTPIMVVERNKLFAGHAFSGFQNADVYDFLKTIKENYMPMARNEAEQNNNYKQPIPYSIILNSDTKKIFTYQRSSIKDNNPETRLHGKWSIGVGGHVEIDKEEDLIERTVFKEITEEIGDMGSIKPRLFGYLNLDNDSVGRVHFGLVYLVETKAKEISPVSSEIDMGRMMSFHDFETLFSDPNAVVEEWSMTVFKALKSRLGQFNF